MRNFVEGRDFFYDDRGRMILTELFHMERGRCCGKTCRCCPFVPKFKRGETKIDKKYE